jgi:hypothetical protein
VLEIMLAVEKAVDSGETIQILSKAPEVDPIPADWTPLQAG